MLWKMENKGKESNILSFPVGNQIIDFIKFFIIENSSSWNVENDRFKTLSFGTTDKMMDLSNDY